jgi:hypothetical protein
MILYRILLAIDAAVAAVLLYFFVTGIEDGSLSSFNILVWLVMLGGIALIIGGALALRARNRKLAATLVLLVPAGPGLLFGLFILLAVLLQPRWN